MSAYCTLADLQALATSRLLVQLTDDDDAGVVDAEVVDEHIEAASAEVDGYLGARYGVPLSISPVPPHVVKMTADIALYNLTNRRGGPNDNQRNRYKDAIRFLELVAAGKLSLGASDPDGTPRESEAPKMSADNPDRLFDRENMRDF